jgi:hypothetical protein
VAALIKIIIEQLRAGYAELCAAKDGGKHALCWLVHQSPLEKEARHFPSPYDGQGRNSASVANSFPSLSPELHLGSN